VPIETLPETSLEDGNKLRNLDIFHFLYFYVARMQCCGVELPVMDVDDIHGRIQEARPYIWAYRK
jgi:hypothetical protein